VTQVISKLIKGLKHRGPKPAKIIMAETTYNPAQSHRAAIV